MQDIDRRSLRTGNVCYILQTSINLLVFIKDFKLFTDCLQTLPVRKLLRSMSCIISLKSPPTTRIPVPCSLQKLLTFLKKDLLSLVQNCKIKPAVIQYTDHQSVVLTFRSGVSEKGRVYWKINNVYSYFKQFRQHQ
jgi:hypothetical protein